MKNQTRGQGQWPHSPIEPPDQTAPQNNALAANDDPVQVEAYRIAEERGFPENAALDHWLEAEKRFSQKRSKSEQH